MKKKKLHILLPVLIVVLLFVAIAVVCILLQRTPMNPPGTIGNSAGNINNRGLFCESDGVVYFSNPYDGGALYSMSPDETNVKKLSSAPVELINADSHFLYYFQTSANGAAGLGYVRTRNGIYRSNLKGKHVVSFSLDPAYSMQLVDNHLYYLTAGEKGPQFYKKKIDRSDAVLLSETATNPACAVGSTIYFNGTGSDHALYALDTLTDTTSTVWEGNLWYPIVSGDYVYYLDVASNYRLCRYSFSNDVIEVLTEDRIDTYNLGGSHIYYQKNSADAPCLMRMGLDGSNPEVVAEGIYSEINLTSQYAYFHPFGSTSPLYRTPLDGSLQVEECMAAKEAALENMK